MSSDSPPSPFDLQPDLADHAPGHSYAIYSLEMDDEERAAVRQAWMAAFPFDHPEKEADWWDAALTGLNWHWPLLAQQHQVFLSLGAAPRLVAEGAFHARGENGRRRKVEPTLGLFVRHLSCCGTWNAQAGRMEQAREVRPWIAMAQMPDEPPAILAMEREMWTRWSGGDGSAAPPFFIGSTASFRQLSDRDLARRPELKESGLIASLPERLTLWGTPPSAPAVPVEIAMHEESPVVALGATTEAFGGKQRAWWQRLFD